MYRVLNTNLLFFKHMLEFSKLSLINSAVCLSVPDEVNNTGYHFVFVYLTNNNMNKETAKKQKLVRLQKLVHLHTKNKI